MINGNTAASFAGGIQNRAVVNVTNSTISNNVSASGGGAAFNVFQTGATPVLSIVNSTVNGNRSNASGGAFQNQNGTINLTNSTLSGNTAPVGAGGAVLLTQGGILNLTFSTVAFNSARGTGGVRISSGAVNSNNSIIARNIAQNPGSPDFSGQLKPDHGR